MTKRTDSRVLVVDDDAHVRQLIQRALARKRIACDIACDGEQATEYHAKEQYDVIVSDLRMPRKHGHRFIVEQLSTPNPPAIIACTGIIDPKIITDLYERGVIDVMMKPLQYDLVALKVKAMLANSAKRKQADSPAQSVAQQIEATTNLLKQQLVDVQATFAETIGQLERRRDELEAGYLDSVRVLTGLMEQLGKFEGSHAVRVERMAVALGESMGLSRQALHALKTAALLHEIGQFGMPDRIRNKAPWEMDADEREAFRQYPIIGAAILSEIHGAEPVVEIISEHTENFDGTGFPHGKRGTEAEVTSRILRVADGIDTFLMHAHAPDPYPIVRAHVLSAQNREYDGDIVLAALKHLQRATAQNENVGVTATPASSLVEGLVLADNVYDTHGRFLARKGAVVTRPLMSCLTQIIGSRPVSVFDPAGNILA